MKTFNLSAWALDHRSFVYFLMLIAILAGTLSYQRLGREEDPAFAIKTMVVSASWPGATIQDTLEQITDRIEKEVPQVDSIDYTKSYTLPGKATITVQFKDTTDPKKLPNLFYQVRKHINDIRGTFPSDMQGPLFDDEFGDVYGNIYAFTSDGLSMRQLRDYVEDVRSAVLHVPNIGKTDLIGTQDEAIYLDISPRKIAGLGIDVNALIKTLQAQNAIAPSGVIQAGSEQVSVRVSGSFASEGEPQGDQPARQRPFLPPERCRRRPPRLRRAAAAAVSLRRQAGDRPGRRHAQPAATCSTSVKR